MNSLSTIKRKLLLIKRPEIFETVLIYNCLIQETVFTCVEKAQREGFLNCYGPWFDLIDCS